MIKNTLKIFIQDGNAKLFHDAKEKLKNFKTMITIMVIFHLRFLIENL